MPLAYNLYPNPSSEVQKQKSDPWWQDQCRLAENPEWHPDSEALLLSCTWISRQLASHQFILSEARLMERLAPDAPESEDGLEAVRRLAQTFKDTPDDEKGGFLSEQLQA